MALFCHRIFAFLRSEERVIPDIPDKQSFKIGEVGNLLELKSHVLRYWETEFRWMAPPKSRSKQRLYQPLQMKVP